MRPKSWKWRFFDDSVVWKEIQEISRVWILDCPELWRTSASISKTQILEHISAPTIVQWKAGYRLYYLLEISNPERTYTMNSQIRLAKCWIHI